MASSEVHALPEAEPVFLTTAPATRRNRQLALVIVAASLLVFIAAVPFATEKLAPAPAFIPIYQSTLAFSDLITAVILLTQYAVLRSSALLVLACGYLFTALAAIVHMLTFPGLFSPTGLLGANPQTTAWVYMFWHSGFPICVIAYALMKDDAEGARRLRASAASAITTGIALVVAAIVALTALATAGQAFLPDIMKGNTQTMQNFSVVTVVWVLSVGALLTLWLRRRRSLLDVWLIVVMFAWVLDVALSAVLNNGRFDLGFYVGRIYGLLAATFVLMVLLFESGAMFAQLSDLLASERREHERDAHER